MGKYLIILATFCVAACAQIPERNCMSNPMMQGCPAAESARQSQEMMNQKPWWEEHPELLNQKLPGSNSATSTAAARRVTAPTPARARAPQDLTPVSPSVLPPTAPLWRLAPLHTQMVLGIRPQAVTSSPLIEQILRSSGGLAAGGVEAFRRESAGVELIVMAMRTGASPLILARGPDIIHAVKSENDPLRYLDPQTIVVGDWNETYAAVGRIMSQTPMPGEGRVAEVAPWSDVWISADSSVLSKYSAGRPALPYVTHFTMGLAMRDEITMLLWLETLSPTAAKALQAQLSKNPQSAPFADSMAGAQTSVDQVDNAVRVYSRVRVTAAPPAPQATQSFPPATQPAEPPKKKVIVIQGLDDGPREIQVR
jgi:hypothetical protein